MRSIAAGSPADERARLTVPRPLAATLRDPPVRAFLASRALVWAAGSAGALLLHRLPGWWGFDAARVSSSFGAVGNVVAAPAVRWDAIWYLSIARHGYTTAKSTIFFPLYPLLVRVLGGLAGSEALAGVSISCASFAVALVLLHRLTEIELGRRAADATVLVLAFAPLSFFFSAVYTESLFLALSVGSVYCARTERWALAGALGGLAAVTRVTGVLLVLPLACLALSARRGRRSPGRPAVPARGGRRSLGWLALVPVGLAAYGAFLAAAGFSILDPLRVGALWGRRSTGPVAAIADAVQAAAGGMHAVLTGSQPIYEHTIAAPLSPGAENIWLLLVLLLVALALRATFQRLPLAYGLYATAAVLVCLWSPLGGRPLASFDRYALTIFPLWMVAGAWCADRRLTPAVVAAGAVLLVLATIDFATWAFVA